MKNLIIGGIAMQRVEEYKASSAGYEIGGMIAGGWIVKSMVSYHDFTFGETIPSNNTIIVVYEM
jgi:hypothetical protein